MGCFVVVGVILNGAWTQLDVIGWPVCILPAVTFLLDANRFRLGRWLARQPSKPESAVAIAIAALVVRDPHHSCRSDLARRVRFRRRRGIPP
jgi:hypothetical protein